MINLKPYTSEFRTNLQLAIPVVMGSLGHIMVSLADDMMVGVLGPVELAATSLGNSLVFIAISIGLGFSFALTPLISEADGERDDPKIRKIFHHGMVFNVIIGVVMLIILFFLKPILYHLNQSPEVVALAIPYYNIVTLSMIPLMIFQGMKQFADGMSKTKPAMKATLLSNVINIFFNFILIYGVWKFPKMGITGAAWGTFISRIGLLFIMYYYLQKDKTLQHYIQRISWKEFEKRIFLKIINLGFPTALQILFEVGVFVSAVMIAGVLGALPQAANQIALKLSSTTFMVAVGVGVATTIRIGNLKGEGDFVNLRRIALSNFLLITLIMFGFSIIFFIFNHWLPYGFTQNVEVVRIAAQLLIIAGLFQMFDGLQAVLSAALRGLQDVWIPSLITFIAYWLIAFPLCYYLGLYTDYKTLGLWIGLSLGLLSAALMLFIRFNLISKKLIQQL